MYTIDALAHRVIISIIKSKVTIEKLAGMVAGGFKEASADRKIIEARLIQRIEILEHRVLNEHSTWIDILEDNVRQIKTKLGIA
ncbi:MAG: hypothetical protein KAR00_01090 [Candidatus Pacebacteria bacterium]|nr:hypothetical protein [Candidatus Paceibacterota bacterium]